MDDDKAEVLACWHRQLDAMDGADTASLRGCFTPDAVLVHMTGYVQPLDEWMDGIRRGEFAYHRVIEDAVRVDVVGDRADLVGDVVTGYREDGSGQAWPLRMTQQYRREDGSWRCSESRVRLR